MEFLPLVAVALLFWLLIVRPASKRQKEVRELQASLKVGDKVVLTSGIFAELTQVGEDRVHVRVAEGVELEVARGGIAAVEAPGPAVPDSPTEL